MFANLLQPFCDDRRRRDWVLFLLGHALIVAVLLALLAIDAEADELAPGPQAWPLIAIVLDAFAPLIILVVTAIGGVLTPKILAFFNVKIDETRAKALNDGFERGATLTLERMGDRLKGGIPLYRKEAAISSVVKYAEQSYPAAIRHFGKTKAELRQMAEIRLSELLVDPAVEQRTSSVVQAEGS